MPFLLCIFQSANDTLLAMQINESETFVVGIGKRKRFSLDITTEIVMTHLSFNFLFPDDSAGETLLTLINPHISFAGTNIACGENILPNVTISNTITMPSTSQDENLMVDLGIITNVGKEGLLFYILLLLKMTLMPNIDKTSDSCLSMHVSMILGNYSLVLCISESDNTMSMCNISLDYIRFSGLTFPINITHMLSFSVLRNHYKVSL